MQCFMFILRIESHPVVIVLQSLLICIATPHSVSVDGQCALTCFEGGVVCSFVFIQSYQSQL